jgi:hypothetical protein
MYSKVYNITCAPGKADALMAFYDQTVTPAIQASEHHVGHLMVENGTDQWILLSNYTSAGAAEAAAGMVRDIVGSMSEFGVELSLIGEGEAARDIS